MDTEELEALQAKLKRAIRKGKEGKAESLQQRIDELTASSSAGTTKRRRRGSAEDSDREELSRKEKGGKGKKEKERKEEESSDEEKKGKGRGGEERGEKKPSKHKSKRQDKDEDEDDEVAADATAEVDILSSINRKRDKLLKKLSRAQEGGEEDRVDELRVRLRRVEKELRALHTAATAADTVTAVEPTPDTVADPEHAKVVKWQRKLSKAVQRGNATRAEKYKNKLKAAGVRTSASESAGAAGDESRHERDLHRAHNTNSGNDGAAVTSSSGKGAGVGDGADAATTAAPATGAGGWVTAPVEPGPVSLLLFYAYVKPHWTPRERARVIDTTHKVLTDNGCTGRLRVALEGFNSTLTGPPEGVRAFAAFLREFDPANFGATDFKITDGLAANKMFKGLKVWPVEELVTYGFSIAEAPLEMGGTHLKPSEWTEMAASSDAVIIDVRNANETAIGRFHPPEGGATLLDPRMRRSTEFPAWVDAHMNVLKDKKVMMYCTAGIRCERASALLGQKGLTNIFQLEGGIHRYLDAYPEDGGIWVGKNYVFDKRFSHGAVKADIVGRCACCHGPWERYQAQAKCSICRMETLLCRACERSGKAATVRLLCWLCEEAKTKHGSQRLAAERAAAAFAATGGRGDGEGEGSASAHAADDDGNISGRKRGAAPQRGRGGYAAKRPRF